MLVWKNSTSPAATFSTGSPDGEGGGVRSEEHTSELQSLRHLVCRLLLEKKKNVWSFRKSLTYDFFQRVAAADGAVQPPTRAAAIENPRVLYNMRHTGEKSEQIVAMQWTL